MGNLSPAAGPSRPRQTKLAWSGLSRKRRGPFSRCRANRVWNLPKKGLKMNKTRAVRLGLIIFLTLLAGALLVGATALPSRAVQPELFKNVSQTSALSLAPVKLQARD